MIVIRLIHTKLCSSPNKLGDIAQLVEHSAVDRKACGFESRYPRLERKCNEAKTNEFDFMY